MGHLKLSQSLLKNSSEAYYPHWLLKLSHCVVYTPEALPQGARSGALRKPHQPESVVPRATHCVVRLKSIRLLLLWMEAAERLYLELCPWDGMAEACSNAGSSTPFCFVLTVREQYHHLTTPKHEKFRRSKDNTVNGVCLISLCWSPLKASPSAELREQMLQGRVWLAHTGATPRCVST